MDLDKIITPLIDLGPIGVIFILVITGFLIPKPFYEREVARADSATDAAQKNAEALKTVTDANVSLKEDVKGLREDVRGLRADLLRVK
jgi:hypothetical protein